MNAAAYRHQLVSLLPRSAFGAFNVEAESKVSAVIGAIAMELARVDERAGDLINESDPRTISETLPEWEAMLGLPDPCVPFEQSTAQRIQAVVAKYIARGGQSPAYFVAVAAALGFVITITEFHRFTANSRADESCWGSAWAFAWQVNAPEASVQYFDANSSADDPAAWWSNEILECVMRRLKPAHTTVVFAYGA